MNIVGLTNNFPASKSGSLVFPCLAKGATSFFLLEFLDGVLHPIKQSHGAFLALILGVAFEFRLEGSEATQFLVIGTDARLKEQVNVAGVRPSPVVDAVFNPCKELVSKRRDQLALRRLPKTSAHLLHVLKCHARVFKNVNEGLTLDLRVRLSRFAILFSTTEHVRLVKLGKASKAFLLLVF